MHRDMVVSFGLGSHPALARRRASASAPASIDSSVAPAVPRSKHVPTSSSLPSFMGQPSRSLVMGKTFANIVA